MLLVIVIYLCHCIHIVYTDLFLFYMGNWPCRPLLQARVHAAEDPHIIDVRAVQIWFVTTRQKIDLMDELCGDIT